MAINLVFSLIVPLFAAKSTEYFHSNNIQYAMYIVCLSVIIESISSVHYFLKIKPLQLSIRTDTAVFITKDFLEKQTQIDWEKHRELSEDNLRQIKDNAKWPVIMFVTNLINNSTQFVSLVYYALFILYYFPATFILFTFVMFGTFYFLPTKASDIDKQINYWSLYVEAEKNVYNMTIHNEANEAIKNVCDMVRKSEDSRSKRYNDTDKNVLILKSVFSMVQVICCMFLVDANFINSLAAIIYIKSIEMIKGNLFSFLQLKDLYSDAKKDYDILYKKLLKLPNIIKPKQQTLPNDFNIEITTLEIPKRIKVIEPLNIKSGTVIRFNGKSGHGKSTFTDVIAGVISTYNHNITLNNSILTHGFSEIANQRVYVEQNSGISKNFSTYSVVSSKYDSIINNSIENYVIEALKMAECYDFIDLDSKSIHDKDSKSIHDKDAKFSGGQSARINIASAIFRILVNKNYRLVILDEIDKAVQADTMVKIMNNIFNYIRSNNMTCIVVAHTTEVKNMTYDQIFKFDQGEISNKNFS